MRSVDEVRKSFPIFDREVRGKNLVYLDNAATTLKPAVVAETVHEHYLYKSANIHRGVHYLSEEATRCYEQTREKVRTFFNIPTLEEVIFTSGTTESVNLVARSYGDKFVTSDDEVLITYMEHHSNIVPWQQLCERSGASLKVANINDRGEVDLEHFAEQLSPKTKIVSFVYISNSLGTINPVQDMLALVRKKSPEAVVMLDAAQAAAHMPIDVQALDCDFLACSSHKMYGPTGTGVLYGKKHILNKMPPFLGGGDMIRTVSFEKTSYADLPAKFEAGTPDIGGVIGFGRALSFIEEVGFEFIKNHETELLAYGTKQLQQIKGLRLIGTAENKCCILGFTLEGVHPHDIGSIVDLDGIAIRAGHHCTQPVMQHFAIPATARASLAIYNTKKDIDALCMSLTKVMEMFA